MRTRGERRGRTWLDVQLLGVTAGAATALVLASLVLPRTPWWPSLRDPGLPWVELLDVRADDSVHTWFNVLLLAGGALLAALAGAAHRAVHRAAWPWALLAAVLGALSLDDMLALHERLAPLGGPLADGVAAQAAWVVPGALVGLAALAVVVLAARRLPRESARPVLVGFALLLLAALGLELAGGAVLGTIGDGAAYILLSHAEELLESFAACLLVLGAARGLPWSPPVATPSAP